MAMRMRSRCQALNRPAGILSADGQMNRPFACPAIVRISTMSSELEDAGQEPLCIKRDSCSVSSCRFSSARSKALFGVAMAIHPVSLGHTLITGGRRRLEPRLRDRSMGCTECVFYWANSCFFLNILGGMKLVLHRPFGSSCLFSSQDSRIVRRAEGAGRSPQRQGERRARAK